MQIKWIHMIISFNFRKLFHFNNLTNGLQDERLHNGIAARRWALPLLRGYLVRICRSSPSRLAHSWQGKGKPWRPPWWVSSFWYVFGVVNKSTFRFVFGVVGILLQSYKKSSAEQKKLVSFFCRDAVTSRLLSQSYKKSSAEQKKLLIILPCILSPLRSESGIAER